MQRKYLIGVDLGTSATKAALYTTDGKLLAEASLEVPLYYPSPGVVEQENEDFYRTAAETVRRCIQDSGVDPRQVAAIAFDSQMAGIGSVDEDFRPATRFDSWLDMRCQPYIEWMDREAGDRVTALTGCPPTCDHGPKMLWWKNERPEEYRRIAHFVTPAGYVAGRMAGLKADRAFMDYTFIHFSGFSDAAGHFVFSDIPTGDFKSNMLNPLSLALTNGPVPFSPGDQLQLKVSARRTCSAGGQVSSGTARLWYNGQPIDNGSRADAGSRFDATIGGSTSDYYLRTNLALSTTAGAARTSIDQPLGSGVPCPDRPFTAFDTWSITP